MKRVCGKKGFTLVEIIVVLVILAILAAILVPSMVGWIDNAQAKACLSALGGIRRSYQAEAAYTGYKVESARPLLNAAVKEWGGAGASSDTGFTCPCGNNGSVVVYSVDKTAILSITCEEHGGMTDSAATTAQVLIGLWDKPAFGKLSIESYFARAQNQGTNNPLNANGGNWGAGIAEEMKKLGCDSVNSLWRIQRIKPNVDTYQIYWAASGTKTGAELGETLDVVCVTYDAANKKVVDTQAGTAEVVRVDSGNQTKVTGLDTFMPMPTEP